MLWITILIIHGLLAFALLGAITHQAFSVGRTTVSKRNFIDRFSSVSSVSYVNAVVLLYLITLLFGGVTYVDYSLHAKPALEKQELMVPVGLFELKEHFIGIGMLLLPVYWLLWKRLPLSGYALARRTVTLYLAFSVWYGFFIGHLLNNLEGIGV